MKDYIAVAVSTLLACFDPPVLLLNIELFFSDWAFPSLGRIVVEGVGRNKNVLLADVGDGLGDALDVPPPESAEVNDAAPLIMLVDLEMLADEVDCCRCI